MADVRGNACYPKADYGVEALDLSKYALKITKIAGHSLYNSITAAQLIAALGVASKVSELENDAGYATRQELEDATHTHDNMTVLNDITAERVQRWDENADNRDIAEYMAFQAFVYNVIYGNVNEFRDIYERLGVQYYDGGYPGMTEIGEVLDGGSPFDALSGTVVDESGEVVSQLTGDTVIGLATNERILEIFEKGE